MNVATAWHATAGGTSVGVAVLDTGVDATHHELKGVLDKRLSGNFIPCHDLKVLFGLGFVDRSACASAATATSKSSPGSSPRAPTRGSTS